MKFLSHHLSADEEEKKRFIHEARAASALDHPNICNIHEIDETKEGQIFICMAHYEGETLKKKVGPAGAGLSVDSVVDSAIQIAQGLAKAHEHGITVFHFAREARTFGTIPRQCFKAIARESPP